MRDSSVGGVPCRAVAPRGGLVRPVLALIGVLAAVVGLVGLPVAVSAQVVRPEADLQLVGSVDEGPPAGGITTGDTLSYRMTIRNLGPTEIPARGLLLVLYVDRTGGSEPWPMEVARFDADGLRPPAGGACGVGRRDFIQCTNSQAIPPDGEIDVRIAHRHPDAVAGALTFVAEVNVSRNTIVDPSAANNSYRGPTYGFVNPPTSTTTSTTVASSTSSTMESTTSSSTTVPSSTSSTMESTTSSSTTVPSSTTSTTVATTTTPTSLTTTSSITPLTGSATLVPTEVVVDAAEGTASSIPGDDQLVLAPVAEDPGDGPPYVLLGGVVFLLLVVGGAGLAYYAHLNRAPPLVDIRTFDR